MNKNDFYETARRFFLAVFALIGCVIIMDKEIRFFFDWGADSCLWGDEGLISLHRLALSEALKRELLSMGAEFQTALDWEYPPDPSPWSKEQKEDFLNRSKIVYERLTAELGDQYKLQFCVFLPE